MVKIKLQDAAFSLQEFRKSNATSMTNEHERLYAFVLCFQDFPVIVCFYCGCWKLVSASLEVEMDSNGFQYFQISQMVCKRVIARSYRKYLGVRVAWHPCCQTRMSPSRHPKCSLRGEQSNLMQSDRVITVHHKFIDVGNYIEMTRESGLGIFHPLQKSGRGHYESSFPARFFKRPWSGLL